MKRIFLFLSVAALGILSSCQGDDGAPGPQGEPGPEAAVLELQNVDFGFNNTDGYFIRGDYGGLTVLQSDNVLVYRMTGTIDSSTPIWQSIPRTLYLNEGELDYDFDFSRADFTIYAGGNFDIATTPQYLDNQTFRIVVIPGYFSNKNANPIDYSDYNAVIQRFHIDDSHPKVIKR